MPVLVAGALRRWMSMIVILGVALGIVDVAFGIMVPLIKDAAASQCLADDGVAGLVQYPLALPNLAPGGRHDSELGAAQLGEINHRLVHSKVASSSPCFSARRHLGPCAEASR